MRLISLPPLKTIIVGIAMMPSWPAVRSSSSVLTLAIVSWPSYSPANSSRIGATARHGPHQGAQKSTTTGTSDFSTCCSKSLSVTVIGLAMSGTSLICPTDAILLGGYPWGVYAYYTQLSVFVKDIHIQRYTLCYTIRGDPPPRHSTAPHNCKPRTAIRGRWLYCEAVLWQGFA